MVPFAVLPMVLLTPDGDPATGTRRPAAAPAADLAPARAAASARFAAADPAAADPAAADPAAADPAVAGAGFVAADPLVVDVTLPAPVEMRADPRLPRGRFDVVRPGQAGLRRDVYETTRRGDEVRRRFLWSDIVEAPVPLVVAYGTDAVADDLAPAGPVRPRSSWVPSGGRQRGDASWYQWHSGHCAHNTLPRGTLVRVTNPANGRSTFCVITDRGIRTPGRVIDMSPDTFDDLAPRSQGIIDDVIVEW